MQFLITVLFCFLIFSDFSSCSFLSVDITSSDVTRFIEILEEENKNLIKKAKEIRILASLAEKVEELANSDIKDTAEVRKKLELAVDRLGETSATIKNARARLITATQNYLLKKKSKKVSSTNSTDIVIVEKQTPHSYSKTVEKKIEILEIDISKYQAAAETLKTNAKNIFENASGSFASVMSALIGAENVQKMKSNVKKILDTTEEILVNMETIKTTNQLKSAKSIVAKIEKLKVIREEIETFKNTLGWSAFLAKTKLTLLVQDIDTLCVTKKTSDALKKTLKIEELEKLVIDV